MQFGRNRTFIFQEPNVLQHLFHVDAFVLVLFKHSGQEMLQTVGETGRKLNFLKLYGLKSIFLSWIHKRSSFSQKLVYQDAYRPNIHKTCLILSLDYFGGNVVESPAKGSPPGTHFC